MKTLKIFEYRKCSTCRKALAFLDQRGIAYEKYDIIVTPPTLTQLREMHGFLNGGIRDLFNTTGELYRVMKLSQSLPGLSEKEALMLLSKHGKLIKRPFLLAKNRGIVGFSESRWCNFLDQVMRD